MQKCIKLINLNTSVSEDHLLVDVAGGVVLQHTLAELIKRLCYCLVLVRRENSGGLNLVEHVDLRVFEELWQILGMSVGDGPGELSRVPLRLLGLLFLWWGLLLDGIAVFVQFDLLLFDDWLRFELLKLIGLKHGWFSLALQTNYGGNLSDIALNLEKLVHVPQRQLFVLVVQLAVVAEALEKDELLTSALLSHRRLNQFEDKIHIEVNCRVLRLLEIVFAGLDLFC